MSRPLTVSWFIVAIVVDAVYLHFSRSLAHVGQEAFEGIPPFTDVDPASAVIFISCVIWILAAISHRNPNIMNGGFGASMRSSESSGLFLLYASTGPDHARPQRVHASVANSAAITDAFPDHAMADPLVRWPNCDKPSVPISGYIYRFVATMAFTGAGLWKYSHASNLKTKIAEDGSVEHRCLFSVPVFPSELTKLYQGLSSRRPLPVFVVTETPRGDSAGARKSLLGQSSFLSVPAKPLASYHAHILARGVAAA